MHKGWFVVMGALASSSAGLVACGDDTLVQEAEGGGPDASIAYDAGGFEASPFDGLAPIDATEDGGDAEAAAPTPARLLVSFNGTKGLSELSAVNLTTGAVDGQLIYPSAYGATAETPTSPWLLEQSVDTVARLDAVQPWVIDSSWNVALGDAIDGGPTYSDPDAVIAAGATVFVLRYNRNEIAVLDSTLDVDAGAPSSTIDLSSQLQKGGDGTVHMSAGWYDGQRYVYVLLGNINEGLVETKKPYAQICSSSHPTIVAIDTSKSPPALATIGDAGGNGWALTGYGTAALTTAPMIYDAPNQRLLVLETGCNDKEADGGLGPLVGRQIEAVSIADGSTKVLATLTEDQFPSSLFAIDATHVVVQTYGGAYMWNPSSNELGALITNAPTDGFAIDGTGNLVGVTEGKGDAGISVVSANPIDGGVVRLGGDPYYADAGDGGNLFQGGFSNGVQLWPAP